MHAQKFESASKLFKTYENMLNANGRTSSLYLNQQLQLSIGKHLDEMDFADLAAFKPRKASKLALSQQQIQKRCREFLQLAA